MKSILLAALVLASAAVRAEEEPVHLVGRVIQAFPDRGYATIQAIQGPRDPINFGNARTAAEMNAIAAMETARWRADNSDVGGHMALRGVTNLAALGMDDVVKVWAIRSGALTLTNAADNSPMQWRLFTVCEPPPPPPAVATPPAAAKPKPEPYKPAPLKPTITRNTKKKN